MKCFNSRGKLSDFQANRTIRSDSGEGPSAWDQSKGENRNLGDATPLLPACWGRGHLPCREWPKCSLPASKTPPESCPRLHPPHAAAVLTQEDQRAEVEDAPHPTARHGSDHPDSARLGPTGPARLGTARYRRCRRMRGGWAGREASPPPRPGPPGARAHTAAGSAPLRPRVMPAAGPGTAGSRRPLFVASLRGSSEGAFPRVSVFFFSLWFFLNYSSGVNYFFSLLFPPSR